MQITAAGSAAVKEALALAIVADRKRRQKEVATWKQRAEVAEKEAQELRQQITRISAACRLADTLLVLPTLDPPEVTPETALPETSAVAELLRNLHLLQLARQLDASTFESVFHTSTGSAAARFIFRTLTTLPNYVLLLQHQLATAVQLLVQTLSIESAGRRAVEQSTLAALVSQVLSLVAPQPLQAACKASSQAASNSERIADLQQPAVKPYDCLFCGTSSEVQGTVKPSQQPIATPEATDIAWKVLAALLPLPACGQLILQQGAALLLAHTKHLSGSAMPAPTAPHEEAHTPAAVDDPIYPVFSAVQGCIQHLPRWAGTASMTAQAQHAGMDSAALETVVEAVMEMHHLAEGLNASMLVFSEHARQTAALLISALQAMVVQNSAT